MERDHSGISVMSFIRSSLVTIVLLLSCASPKQEATSPSAVVVSADGPAPTPAPGRSVPTPSPSPSAARSVNPLTVRTPPAPCTTGDRWRDGVRVCDGDPSYTCHATEDEEKRCAKLATSQRPCRVEPPPAYWSSPAQGIRLSEEQNAAERERLKQRPVPACLCSCSAEYQRQHDQWLRDQKKVSAL